MRDEKVEYYEAIQEWANGNNVYFINDEDRYDLYRDVLAISKINDIETLWDSPEEDITLDNILHADWYVEFK